MDAQATPQDVLLAYNDDFTEFTSVNKMAQPFQQTGGGSEYYEDFSTRLERFINLYNPRALSEMTIVVPTGFASSSDDDDDSDSSSDDNEENVMNYVVSNTDELDNDSQSDKDSEIDEIEDETYKSVDVDDTILNFIVEK